MTITQRFYVRVNGEHEQSITMHVDDDGYIRMTADSLEHLLIQLGFIQTTVKEPTP